MLTCRITPMVVALSLLACTRGSCAPSAENCTERYRRVLEWNGGIAAEFRDEDTPANRLTRRARSMHEVARGLLAECPAGGPLSPEQVARVEIFAARLDLVLSKVIEAETRQQLQAHVEKEALSNAVEERHRAYLAGIVERCDSALALLEPGDGSRLDGIRIIGQASAAARDDSRARDAYELFLGEFDLVEGRDPAEAAEVTGWLGTVYQRLELFDEGIALLEDALKRYEKTPSAPRFLETLWTLQLARGDIEAMARTSRRAIEEVPRRLEELKLSPRKSVVYEGHVVFHLFRLAQAELALGNAGRAESLLREHLAAVERAEKAGGAPAAWRVHRDLAVALLGFVRESAGRPAPPLDLESGWLDGEPWSLARGRGKVLAILFRLPGNDRSALFLERLNARIASRDDVEIVVVSLLMEGDSVAEMREELAALGFRGRAVAVRDRAVFDAFGAWVGTATFQLVDRDGNLQWFQLDPRAIDVRFSTAIIDRLAGQ